MSTNLRILYRDIPENKRLCYYYRCGEPILRNIDRDERGRLYHHGCLLSARSETWKCLECFARFNATEACFETVTETVHEGFMAETLKPYCPHCGSHNLSRRRIEA